MFVAKKTDGYDIPQQSHKTGQLSMIGSEDRLIVVKNLMCVENHLRSSQRRLIISNLIDMRQTV